MVTSNVLILDSFSAGQRSLQTIIATFRKCGFTMIYKAISTVLLLMVSLPVFAMWGGGHNHHGGEGFNPARPSIEEKVEYLSNRMRGLEERIAYLERSCGGAMARPTPIWDCILTTDFNEVFTASGEVEMLLRGKVLKDCQEKAQYKLCNENQIKCLPRNMH